MKKREYHNGAGYSKTRLYMVYSLMLQRTENTNDKDYRNYGGRGIKVCDEWKKDFMLFRNWAYNNGYDEKAPKGKCTLDRINVDGNYEPSNCRWVTSKQQANNRRKNKYLTHNNETFTISEWSEKLDISSRTILKRIRMGWDVDKTLTTPVDKKYSRSKENRRIV